MGLATEMAVREKGLTVTEQKLVDFNGAEIMAIRCNDGKVRVGVRWICNGLAFDENQYRVQVRKIQDDITLQKGVTKMSLPTSGGNQEVLCLELSFLPLWLAKINANIIDDQEVQDRLVNYQLNAKDVLADAFIGKQSRQRKTSIPPWERAAIGEIRFAKEFAKATGIRTERAIAVALARIECETGRSLAEYRRTLPPIEQEEAEILTASQIGEKINKTANVVNLMLEELNLQEGKREPGKKEGTQRLVKRNPWQLTEKGKAYGIMQDSAKQTGSSKWEGFQILWKTKVVDMLISHLSKELVTI
jgi:hypothetical protein